MSKGKRVAERPKRSAEKRNGSMRRAGRIALLVLASFAAVVLLAVAAWKSFVVAPDVGGNDEQKPVVQQGAAGTDGKQESEISPEEIPEKTKTRKEDYFTFLLIGKDTSSGSTDTLILVSYDVPNGQVNLMSIPRDTVVNVPWAVKKINSVYSASEESGGGMENLKKQVAGLTGVMPDFYAIIEWKAVGRIVDAVGGVEFYVPRNMNYDDPYQDLHIHLTKGSQRLTGAQAMAMLRYRTDNDKSIGYGEPGRTETQRNFLKAMAGEVLQLKNMTRIGAFIEIFMENVSTDLKLNDLMWFASKALGVDLSTMNSSTLPYIDVGIYRGGYYFMADADGILPLVNEQFNPYEEEMTADDLRIVQRRDDGSCYVTNGELLDANWAKPYSGSMRGEAAGGEETVLVGSNVSGGSPATWPEEEEPEEDQTSEGESPDPEQGDSDEEQPGEIELPGGEAPDPGTDTPEEDSALQPGELPEGGPEGEVPETGGDQPAAEGDSNAAPESPVEDSEIPDWLN